MTRFILFLFAYIPIYIIAALKSINPALYNKYGFIGIDGIIKNNIETTCLLILTISLLVYFKVYESLSLKASGNSILTIKSINSQNKEYITYLGTYILPFIALETKTVFDVLAYIFLFLTMGFVYARTNLVYTNPMLMFFKYEIYEITDTEDEKIVCITKEKLKVGDKPKGIALGEKTYILAKWRKEN